MILIKNSIKRCVLHKLRFCIDRILNRKRKLKDAFSIFECKIDNVKY